MSIEWFRSWHGAPVDPKWRTVAKRAQVKTCVVVSIAWALMDRASRADDRGSISGVDLETLADFLDCECDEIERVIAAMRDKGVLEGDRLSAWDKRQPKREREDDSSAARVEAHRLRNKINELEEALQSRATTVTPCNASDSHETPAADTKRLDKEKEKIREEKIREKRAHERAAFDRFWEIWPNKAGRPAAERAFGKCWQEADAIIAGVERYVRSKPPDRPWLNPATFLNQRRWEDAPAALPLGQPAAPPQRSKAFETSLPASRF